MPAVAQRPERKQALMGASHTPVMVERVRELLTPVEPGLIVDTTVGLGGHAAALLTAAPEGTRLLGIDRDPEALGLAGERLADFGERVELVQASFDELGDLLDERDDEPVRAVLYDLGVSSLQLDRAERGFSLQAAGPLDLRMDPTRGETAAELIDRLDRDELAAVLRDYGEERHARRIAAAIVRARPLRDTVELADVVTNAVPTPARHGPRHPATRTFQALRIAVNGELERFRASLPQALERLTPAPAASPAAGRGGRLAVLAYHSLEDRLAKRLLGDAARGCVCPPDLPVCGCGREPLLRLLTRGAEQPEPAEIAANPRARSARLRAGERTAVAPDGPATPENPERQ